MLPIATFHSKLVACLAGKTDQVEKVILVRNQAQSPVRFVMDPYEQLEAFNWIEFHGLRPVGIFHSHPAGPETASATDIAEAAYEVIYYLVTDGGSGRRAAFLIENGGRWMSPLDKSRSETLLAFLCFQC